MKKRLSIIWDTVMIIGRGYVRVPITEVEADITIENQNLYDRIRRTNFLEGTLVEYLEGSGFDREYGRGTIMSAQILSDHINVKTLEDTALFGYDGALEDWGIALKNGVFYLENPMMWNYALAPKRICIPEQNYN